MKFKTHLFSKMIFSKAVFKLEIKSVFHQLKIKQIFLISYPFFKEKVKHKS